MDGYARIRELDQGIGEAEHSRSIRMEEQSRLRGENARTKEEIGRIDALSARPGVRFHHPEAALEAV